MTLSAELQFWLAACIPGLLATFWLLWKTYLRRLDAIAVHETPQFIRAVTWVLGSHLMLLLFWFLYVVLGIASALEVRTAPPVPSTRLGEFIVGCLIGGVFVLAAWTYGNIFWIIYQERKSSNG